MRRGDFRNSPKHVSFNQNWAAYKEGFGDMYDEFWIGNENLHKLTASGDQLLQIDLESFDGDILSLQYRLFKVGDESSSYRLEIGEPVNNFAIANQLLKQNQASFSTFDHLGDQQSNCPQKNEAGWWFKSHNCHNVLLTGVFNENDVPLYKEGIQWPIWKDKQFLKAVQMKIKPKY
jgi:hypothetical protein